MADNFQLKAIITAVDRLSGPLKGMQRQLKGFQKEVSSLALGAAGAGTAIMGALALPVKSAITLESKMADVRKVVDGLDTPDAFKAMTEQVRALSTELPMSADGIAEIVAAGGQAGIARDELMQFATDAVKMGVAFDTTAEESGQMMAQWRTAFNMTQDEVAGLADKINYLGNTGPANAKKISDIVTRIGPLGGVAGVASGEIAAMGATIAGMGVESEIAATGIKNFMLSLTAGNSATKSQKQALRFLRINPKKLAADMQKDARGTMLSVLDAMAKVPKEKQAAVLNALFGKESLGAIAPLLTNLDLLRTNFRRVADSQQYGSSMQKEYASRASTTENQLLEEVRTFVRENPELVKTIAKIGLALLTVGAAAGSLSRIMKVLGGVMNMTPAKGLIALLVGGAYLIIDNWETVGPVIKKVWHVVDETAQVMGGWETVLKAIALFMATKWVADVTKSITAVTREMRTLGKVSAETGLMGKGRGFIGKAGVYGFWGTLMYEPVKDTLESVVPEDTVNWLDNKGLFLASDWTPFFDRKEYEQYQASLSQYKPNVPLLNPSSSMTQHSELKVTFENAPPGMKIIDVPGKADPLMKITHDVGYSPFRFPR